MSVTRRWGRSPGRATGRIAVLVIATSVGLTGLVALVGTSVAEAALGRDPDLPFTLSDALGGQAAPWWVVGTMLTADLLGGVGLLVALRALRAGWRPDARRLLGLSGVVVAALVSLPPVGSADQLSYAAYGRIAASGANPYTVAPDVWRHGLDPVAGAVAPPWQSTPSVYGPVATAEQTLASLIGGSSLALTVLCLSVLNGAAFWLTGWLLVRLSGHDPERRARAALLWGLNPLLLGLVVCGAHVDALAVAWGVAGLFALRRSPLAAGALLGLGVSTKASMVLFLVAAAWPLRHRWRDLLLLVGAAAATTVAVYLPWGPGALNELRGAAARVSTAVPWRPVGHLLTQALGPVSGSWVLRIVVLAASALVLVAAASLLPRISAPHHGPPWASAWRCAALLVTAWVLAGTYVLPWYYAALWAPLATVAASRLDGFAVAATVLMAWAYVPGLVAIPDAVADPTLDWRTGVAPWLSTCLLVAFVGWGLAARRRATSLPT
ncbi:MAG: hypothetical protein ACRDP1_06970 [Nocardioidaceae bacterium]